MSENNSDIVKIAAELKQAYLRIEQIEKKAESDKKELIATIKELERRMNSSRH